MNNNMSKNIDFSSIDVPIPKNIDLLSSEEQEDVLSYLIQLDNIQKKAYNIAFHHLGTSFNICKSNGFCEWIKHKNKNH